MPGYGYRVLKPQPVSPLQRVVNLIGDMQDRMSGIEASRPGFSVADVDPTVPGAPGMTHLNKLLNRLWVYTTRGWITADSYQRLATSEVEAPHSSTAYGSYESVQVHVPPGGGFVNVYASALVRSASGTAGFEIALYDGVDLVDTRVIAATANTSYGQATSEPANSAGGSLGSGGWITYWSSTAGTRTLILRIRVTGATGIFTTQRRVMAVVF